MIITHGKKEQSMEDFAFYMKIKVYKLAEIDSPVTVALILSCEHMVETQ